MMYIVTWVITLVFSVPCPLNSPSSEYGINKDFVYAVHCQEEREQQMEKAFSSYEDAKAFVENAPPEIRETMTIIKDGTNDFVILEG